MVEDIYERTHRPALRKIGGLLSPAQRQVWGEILRWQEWRNTANLSSRIGTHAQDSPMFLLPARPIEADVFTMLNQAAFLAEHLTFPEGFNARAEFTVFHWANQNGLRSIGPAFFSDDPLRLGHIILDHTLGRLACLQCLLEHHVYGDWDDQPETEELEDFLTMHRLIPGLYLGNGLNYEDMCAEQHQRSLFQDEFTLMFLAQVTLPMDVDWDGDQSWRFSRLAYEADITSQLDFAGPLFEALLRHPEWLPPVFRKVFKVRLDTIKEQLRYFEGLGEQSTREVEVSDGPSLGEPE